MFALQTSRHLVVREEVQSTHLGTTLEVVTERAVHCSTEHLWQGGCYRVRCTLLDGTHAASKTWTTWTRLGPLGQDLDHLEKTWTTWTRLGPLGQDLGHLEKTWTTYKSKTWTHNILDHLQNGSQAVRVLTMVGSLSLF